MGGFISLVEIVNQMVLKEINDYEELLVGIRGLKVKLATIYRGIISDVGIIRPKILFIITIRDGSFLSIILRNLVIMDA